MPCLADILVASHAGAQLLRDRLSPVREQEQQQAEEDEDEAVHHQQEEGAGEADFRRATPSGARAGGLDLPRTR